MTERNERNERPKGGLRTPRKRLSVQTNVSDTGFQQKLNGLVELQKGIKILRDRITTSKKDLIHYFESNPSLKTSKYMVDEYAVHYVDKKTTDGISQKLIIAGLSQYFKLKGMSEVGREVTQALNMIKDQRQTKISPSIDIRAKNGRTINEEDDE